MRNPPTTGKKTFGQEYHAYSVAKSEVVMFRDSFISIWRAPGLSKQKKAPNPTMLIKRRADILEKEPFGAKHDAFL